MKRPKTKIIDIVKKTPYPIPVDWEENHANPKYCMRWFFSKRKTNIAILWEHSIKNNSFKYDLLKAAENHEKKRAFVRRGKCLNMLKFFKKAYAKSRGVYVIIAVGEDWKVHDRYLDNRLWYVKSIENGQVYLKRNKNEGF